MGHPNPDQLRVLVSEECREIDERRKRVSSIIIRDVSACTPAALIPLFDSISTELVGSPIQLSDVVCIDGENGLFRAKIQNTETRQKLLDSAKNLKNSQNYSSVFISRDLTYNQRQSLIARRARPRETNNSSSDGTFSLTAGGGGGGVRGGSQRPSSSNNFLN